MERKIFFGFLLLLFAIVLIQNLEAVTIEPWMGYATVTMNEVIDDLNKVADVNEAIGSTVTVTGFSGGYTVGLDIGALRLGYLMPQKASMYLETFFFGITQDIEASMMMGMLGFRSSRASGLSFGLYAGYGYATLTTGVNLLPIPDIVCTGGDVIGEASIGIRLSESMALDIGYRYAVIKEVTATADYDTNGDSIPDIYKGDTFDNIDGEPIVFDYSGLAVNFVVRFGGKPKEAIYQGYGGLPPYQKQFNPYERITH